MQKGARCPIEGKRYISGGGPDSAIKGREKTVTTSVLLVKVRGGRLAFTQKELGGLVGNSSLRKAKHKLTIKLGKKEARVSKGE